jgi:hypothetical protein
LANDVDCARDQDLGLFDQRLEFTFWFEHEGVQFGFVLRDVLGDDFYGLLAHVFKRAWQAADRQVLTI